MPLLRAILPSRDSASTPIAVYKITHNRNPQFDVIC